MNSIFRTALDVIFGEFFVSGEGFPGTENVSNALLSDRGRQIVEVSKHLEVSRLLKPLDVWWC